MQTAAYTVIRKMLMVNRYTVHHQLFVHITLNVTSCSASSGGTDRVNTCEKVSLVILFIKLIMVHRLSNIKFFYWILKKESGECG